MKYYYVIELYTNDEEIDEKFASLSEAKNCVCSYITGHNYYFSDCVVSCHIVDAETGHLLGLIEQRVK